MTCYDIYPSCREWENEDRNTLKTIWKMNYFSLTPNYDLVKKIQEDVQKEFKVLEKEGWKSSKSGGLSLAMSKHSQKLNSDPNL